MTHDGGGRRYDEEEVALILRKACGLLALLAALAGAACQAAPDAFPDVSRDASAGAAASATASGAPPASGQPAPRLAAERIADTTFARLVEALSEPGGYFDTDNLISNETSYLHVLGPLRERGVTGGAFLGVGPDQSFSYVAQIRPEIAFMVDVRRDNLLHHLLLKALFTAAPTRVEYLSLLHGRPAPGDPAAWTDRSAEAVVAWVDGREATEASVARARAVVDSLVAGFGVPLDAEDRATIGRFHREFIDAGLSLRFRSHGRAPRPYYPTYRQLVLERDLTGEGGSYLADAGDYRFLRELQLANRVVPVVGDLAGPHALRAIGEELRERGLGVSAFYTSNVEFYLYREGTFPAFVGNVRALPVQDGGVLVRSYFPSFHGRHPHQVPGYWSTQSLQTLGSFLRAADEAPYASYWDLVTRDAVDPR